MTRESDRSVLSHYLVGLESWIVSLAGGEGEWNRRKGEKNKQLHLMVRKERTFFTIKVCTFVLRRNVVSVASSSLLSSFTVFRFRFRLLTVTSFNLFAHLAVEKKMKVKTKSKKVFGCNLIARERSVRLWIAIVIMIYLTHSQSHTVNVKWLMHGTISTDDTRHKQMDVFCTLFSHLLGQMTHCTLIDQSHQMENVAREDTNILSSSCVDRSVCILFHL